MYASDSDVWSTQITELITSPQVFLTIQPAGTNVVVSWPNIPGYQLQSTTNFSAVPIWANIAQTPSTNNNGFLALTRPVSGASHQFFRLLKQ